MLRFYSATILLALSLMVFLPVKMQAQNNQMLHLNDQVYSYIKNMQLRGYMADLNPTLLPYTKGEVNRSLKKVDKESLSRLEHFWYEQIDKEAGFEDKQSDKIFVDALLEGGFDLNNTLGSEGIRPQAEKIFFLPNGAGQLYGESGSFAAQLGLSHDLFYDQDRLGQNSLNRVYMRSEDYYIGYQNNFLKAYMGRFKHLWSPYGEASTVISRNAQSFDNLSITLGNSWFQVSGILAELDNLGKDGTFDLGGKNRINGIKRFLTLHRIDIKVTDHFRLGYFDGFIYSSDNSITSMKYLNPTNVLFFDRNSNPVNDEFNAFFGGLIWAQYQNLTFNLQLMIDDIVIKSGEIRQDIEPATFAITHSMHLAGITDFIDAGYEAELVAYQTYNTDQAEGRYLFLKRGIATQFTDYGYVSGYVNIYMHPILKGLTLSPRFSYLAQGEQEINQEFVDQYPNGETIDMLLSGTEEKTSRISLDLNYNPLPEFWINASLGYNYLTDKDHLIGKTDSRITARFETGFRINLESYVFK